MEAIYWTGIKVGDYLETHPPTLQPYLLGYPPGWRGRITRIQNDAHWNSPDIITAVNGNEEHTFTDSDAWRVDAGPYYCVLGFYRCQDESKDTEG